MHTRPVAQFVDTDRIARYAHRDLLLMRLCRPGYILIGKFLLAASWSPANLRRRRNLGEILFNSNPMIGLDPAEYVANLVADKTALGDFSCKEKPVITIHFDSAVCPFSSSWKMNRSPLFMFIHWIAN